MAIAKVDFLWYSKGEVIDETELKENPHWIKENLVDLKGVASKPEDKSKPNSDVAQRIEEITEDLLDDGKRNYSNNPKKNSPGRKKKRKRS